MAEEKVFLVKGEISEKGINKPFQKKVRAKSRLFAIEKTLALFGSKNKLKRNKVFVSEAEEVRPEDATKKGS